MAKPDLFETVCPACAKAFELPIGTTEGDCPHCHASLRFAAEPVAPEPAAPPLAAAPAFDAAASSTPEAPAIPAVLAPAEPGPGEFRVHCPACDAAFNVGAAVEGAACPQCASPLRLEDEYAEVGLEFPVECPNCHAAHEVPLGSHQGTCPHCGARLTYDDVFPEPNALLPSTNGEASLVPAPELTTPQPKGPESPATPASGVPSALVPPEPFPTTVDCPSCKKSFAIPADGREGACPHCSTPLAFVSEKEFFALQIAEEKKRRMQEKLAARRLQEKQKELERQKAEEAERLRRLEVAATTSQTEGPGSERAGFFSVVRFARKKTQPGAPTEGPVPARGALFSALKFGRRKTEPEAPTAVVTNAVEVPPEPRPVRGRKPEAAPIEVETTIDFAPAPIAAPPAKPSKKKEPAIESIVEIPPIVDAPTIEIGGEVHASPSGTEPPRTGLLGRFRKRPAAGTPAPSAVVEMGEVSFGELGTPAGVVEETQVSVAAAASPPPSRKKSLFGRRVKQEAAPQETPPAATIDMGEIEVHAASPQAAVVETSEFVLESNAPSVEAGESARPKKGRRRQA